MRTFLVIILISTLSITVFGIEPDSHYAFTPKNFGLMYKEFKVRTVDNVSINVWFCPVQDSTNTGSRYLKKPVDREYKNDDTVKHPTIILCDADSNNMSYLLSQAYFLCMNGYNVITFDWRGFGKSQEWKFDENVACLDFLKDYDAVLDTVIRMKEVDNNRIGAHSFSTGAYISFLEFSARSEIKALAVRGMFTSYKELVKNVDLIDPGIKHPYPVDFNKPEYRAIDLAPKITKPVFFIVGEQDIRTPPEMSIRLLLTVNSFIRDLWIVKGAKHGGFEAPEVIDWKGFKQRMLDFYKQNL